MATKTWTLTDRDAGDSAEPLRIDAAAAGGPTGSSILKKTLHGGLSQGVDVVVVDNGAGRWELLPTRGMGIWKGWLGGEQVGWTSPVRGPVHPHFVPLGEPGGLGWLDGFDELLVRCGLESNGAPEFDEQGRLRYPLHGRIANRPAHYVEASVDGDSGELSVTGVVDETRFHFQKLRLRSTFSTGAGEAGFRIHDEVENLSGAAGQCQLLYHVNFGDPLLDAGARLLAPARAVVPRNDHAASSVQRWADFEAAQAGFEEQVYFLELLADDDGDSHCLLRNAHGVRGVSLRFPKRQLPCFTLWKNTTATTDGYVTGLEPGTNYPNPRSFESRQGRLIELPPGGKAVFQLEVRFYNDAEQVSRAEQRMAALQERAERQIFTQPQASWCAPG